MAQSATTSLDSRQFERALAVLERERPSRQEETRFRLLNQAIWGAFMFSCLWALWLPFQPEIAYPILILAGLCYAVSIPLFFVNLRLVRKLYRAAFLRRNLRLSQRLQSYFDARRHRHRLYNLFTLALNILGYPLCLLGLAGLSYELRGPTPGGLLLSTILIVFGLSCIFIHFMSRGQERLDVIHELRRSLLESRESSTRDRHEPVELSVEAYDQIAGLERTQIRRDRKRSIVKALQTPSDSYVLRMSRGLRHVESELDADDLMRVNERIQRLLVDPRPADARDEPGNPVSYVPVPETSFEVGFNVDHDRREIQVVALRSPALTGSLRGVR